MQVHPSRADETGAVAPRRVQIKRSKGWRMPPNTVKVDRSTGWGNPWIAGSPGRVKLHSGHIVQIGPDITTAGAVDCYRRWMAGEVGFVIGEMVRHPLFDTVLCPGAPPNPAFLAGKDLACWCKPGEPCHADVLLELANAEVARQARRSAVSPDGEGAQAGSGGTAKPTEPSDANHIKDAEVSSLPGKVEG